MATGDTPERDANEPKNTVSKISENRSHLNLRTAQVAITPAQLRVVRGLDEGLVALGSQPTCREVALLTDLSTSVVRDHVVHLRRIGVVDRDSMRVVRRPTGVMLRRTGNGWST